MRVLDEDGDGVVVRAAAAALAVLAALAEHEALDALVVPLGLLGLLESLLPEHLGEQVAALRHRRLPQEAQAPVGVDLDDAGVDVGELVDVVVDNLLRLGDAALEKLEVRAHRDGAAEVHGAVVAPKEVVERLLGRGEERPAVLGLRLRGEPEVYLDGLGGDVEPDRVVVVVVLVEHPGELEVRLGGGLEILVLELELPPLEERLAVEGDEALRGLGVVLEELAVDGLALLLLAAPEVVVGDLEARRPVLGALPVGKRRDLLLRLVELVEHEKPADLYGEERGLGLRPLLLGGLDHALGEVGEAAVDKRLDVCDLALQLSV